MSKTAFILSGSPRRGGNSDLLCDEFLRGAAEAGNRVEKIFLRSKKIAPCSACYYCKTSGGKCAISDDIGEILDKMQAAEDSETVMDCTLECFRGFAACLDGAREMGVIEGKGVYEAGAVRATKYMQEAYEMGKRV